MQFGHQICSNATPLCTGVGSAWKSMISKNIDAYSGKMVPILSPRRFAPPIFSPLIDHHFDIPPIHIGKRLIDRNQDKHTVWAQHAYGLPDCFPNLRFIALDELKP